MAKAGGAPQEGDPTNDLKITLWKNGFTIGETEGVQGVVLRDY